MRHRKDYNSIDWKELVYYDAESPSGLRWKSSRLNCSGSVVAKKDSPAGSLTDHGYWVIPNKSSYYKVHRVVWIITTGNDIDNLLDIDHINGNRSDNRLSNLRLVKEIVNRRNKKKMTSNSSGYTGVGFRKRVILGVQYDYVIARWNNISGRVTKYFSIKEHGLLPAFAMACQYREDKIKELNEQGYGYSENHGK